MYRILLILLLAVVFIAGCGSEDASNTNESAGNENANVESDAPDETSDSGEVAEYDDAEKALARGIEYLDGNEFEKAIEVLKQAVELDEDLADAHFQLGVALALQESEKERSVEDDDDEDSSKKKKKEKKESEIAFENAVKAYRKVIREDSKDHEAHFNLGMTYVKLFDDEKARKSLERAVKLNDEDPQYRTELGAVLVQLAQYGPAIKQLNKAIELDDTNYRAEDLLAKARAGRKRVGFTKTPRPGATRTTKTQPGADKTPAASPGASPAQPAKPPAPPPPPKPAPKKTAGKK